MAKLTAKARKALPDSAFAGPNRSYPVEDKGHAKAAKTRAAEFASPSLEAKVDAKANKVLGKPKGHRYDRNAILEGNHPHEKKR